MIAATKRSVVMGRPAPARITGLSVEEEGAALAL